VDNDGNLEITVVTVNDDVCGAAMLDSGDDGDNILQPTETWVFTCVYVVQAGDFPGPLVNTGTASGTAGGNPVSAQDMASVDLNPIRLTKTGDVMMAGDGDPVNYSYTVNNDGVVDITVVTVIDDKCAPVIFDSGDDGDSILQPTETWIYTCAYVVVPADFPGPLVNTGTVNGTAGVDPVSDQDTWSVTLTPPAPTAEPQIVETDGDNVDWTDVPGAVNYHMYRGDLSALLAGGPYVQDPSDPNVERFCWLTESAQDDGFAPLAGQVVFYLVTADDGTGEGGLGDDGQGDGRENGNPCR
jgi:hypothetical protein